MSYNLKNKNSSVKSVNIDNDINISLSNTYKNRVHTDVVSKINSRQVFEDERSKCNKYRLIFNIKPYCTNVLFNPFTEIVRYKKDVNGNLTIEMINDKDCENISPRVKHIQDTSISRSNMGDNFKGLQNFEYLPGYDMFNNHILRDKSFKIVSDITNTQNKEGIFYNSLTDYMRDCKGNNIEMYQRFFDTNTNEFAVGSKMSKHLYHNDDILNFIDGSALSERLKEKDGWFGFENVCQIKTRDVSSKDIKIDKVINNKMGGDFIDMYPDRSLFSFNPKHNTLLNRLEYNWHFVLTYPFAIDRRHSFCSFNNDGQEQTGLKLLTLEKQKDAYGNDIILCRTYTKHGLNKGDMFRLCISPYGKSNEDEKIFYNVLSEINVSDLGDISGKYKDYYFKTENMEILDAMSTILKNDGSEYDIYGTHKDGDVHNWLYNDEGLFDDDKINIELSEHEFIINRVYNGVPSEYYFRLFKEIPNLKFKKEELTTEKSLSLENYINYLKNNDLKFFDKDISKLAFASTVYNDDLTQLLYSDDIDLTNIVDHLGRPLSEFYLTIIKNNKGNEEWYNSDNWLTQSTDNYWDFNNDLTDDIEFSHCFGKLSCGLNFGGFGDIRLRAQNGDIHLINELGAYGASKIGDYITKDGLVMNIISKNGIYRERSYIPSIGETVSNLFYGDFVEFSPFESKEKVLSDCLYRFNTYQREMQENELFSQLCGWDILSDDYDVTPNIQGVEPTYNKKVTEDGNFVVWSKNYVDKNIYYNLVEDTTRLQSFQRPEGYFYKPHYQIPIKEWGELKQESHYDIEVRYAQPVQINGIYISINTTLKHNCLVGDKVYICDDTNNKWWYTYVISVIDKTTLYIDKNLVDVDINSNLKIDWVNVCVKLNEGKYKFRRHNEDIPRYAHRMSNCQYIWREYINIGNINALLLPEYPYLNESFYINTDINFFLRRQDASSGTGLCGINMDGLYPLNIDGNIREESIYEYKDENEITC